MSVQEELAELVRMMRREREHRFKTRAMTADLITGNSNPVASLQANDLDPGQYTVQFEITQPPDATAPFGIIFYVQALIKWKVYGQQLQRVITVVNGASITGVAEAVDVQLVDVTKDFTFVGLNNPYKVGATLSRGTRANVQQPAVLQEQKGVLLAHGVSVIFDMPSDAGVISRYITVVGVSGAINPTDVVAQDILPAPSSDASQNYPLIQTGWVPMSSGAQGVQIVNNSSTESVLVNVFWGIDG